MKKIKHYIITTFTLLLLCRNSISFAQYISFFPDTLYACQNDTIKLSIPTDILTKSANIQWITPYSIIYHSSSLNVYQEGKYILKIRTKQSEIIDSVMIIKTSPPVFQMKDTTICADRPFRLPLQHPTYEFYSMNNLKINFLLIQHAGKYAFKISNKGCTITQTINVKTIAPTIPEQKEYVFCINDENKKINLKHNGFSSILWSNGSTQKSIIVENEDNYWIKISDKYCGTKIDTIQVKFKPCNCEILIPNSFTPNDDGKNDYFYPILSCEYSYYNFTIYDKWNNIVFSSNNPNARWDGKFKGNPLPEDVYVYVLETIEKNSGKKNTRKGKFSLIR